VTATVLTNLVAPIDLTRQLLPDLVAQQGRVVLVGSTTSFVPLPYLALYGATKAALHHFGAALRHEITPLGVHLLMAYPPATATALTAAMAARTAAIRRRKPALAAPEQIGAAIVHALAAGKRECIWWGGEHLLRLFYRLAPRLTERLLFAQRQLLRHTLGDATTAAVANEHE
jgi:short-subunit dehydrogenase